MRLTHQQVERYKILLEHWVMYRDSIPNLYRLDAYRVQERRSSVFDTPPDYAVDPMGVETRMRIITFEFERRYEGRRRFLRVWSEDFWLGDIEL